MTPVALAILAMVSSLVLARLAERRIALRDERIRALEAEREADIDEAAATYAEMRAEIDRLRFCENVGLFVDGELASARTEAFQLHLATCETCQRESLAHIQLSARLSGLGDPE